MPPEFIVPESTLSAAGESALFAVPETAAQLLLTLGITKVIEQQSLDVSIFGSSDGESWSRLTAFPQKFYTGVSTLLLDLTKYPDTHFLRAQWKLNRWGRGEKTPLFTVYLVAEEA